MAPCKMTNRLFASVVLPLPSVILSPTTTSVPESAVDQASTAETKYLECACVSHKP